MSKRVKLYMGLPTVSNVVDCQAYMLRELQEKYGDKVELVYPKVPVRRIFHDFARNEIVKEFLATDCDVLWFLDSDIGPSKHVLELVTEHYDKWLVAGAPYPVFMKMPGEEDAKVLFCVYTAQGDKFFPSDIPYEGTSYVDGIATGCLFIKREVFEKIEAPWFEFKYDPITREPTHGEDIMFCKKAREKGIKFFTDFSMVCKHYKNVCLLELNNYSINMRNQAVLAYDRDVRGKVEQLEGLVRKLLAERKMNATSQSKTNLILPPGY